jgi:PKD repeat protein
MPNLRPAIRGRWFRVVVCALLPAVAVGLGMTGGIGAQTLSLNAGGPYNGQVGVPLTFTAQANLTAPQIGVQATYQWNFGDGTSANGQVVQKIYAGPGSFPVTVSLLLPTGQVLASANTIATIVGGQGQIVVNVGGPYTAAVGQPVAFSGSATGAFAGAGLTYQWTFGDGTNGTGQFITHAYGAAGTYPVTLLVSSPSGQTGIATTTATIGGGTAGTVPGSVQVSAGGPYTGSIGQPITFTATVSGAFNPIFQWDFGDGATGAGQSVMHTYTTTGTYTVTLTVAAPPSFSVSATSIATVTTAPAAPPALQVDAGGPYLGAPGQPVTLTASAPVSASGQYQYQWTFGDGTSGSGQSLAHIYATDGAFIVTLTVTDRNSGRSGMDTTTVTIGSPASATVMLLRGCNNVTVTWPNGTPIRTIADAIVPTPPAVTIWRYDASTRRFQGYNPAAATASDLSAVNRLDSVFICVMNAATFSRPPA